MLGVNSSIDTASGWDLYTAAVSGAQTGGKANKNAFIDMVASTVTLGQMDDLEVYDVGDYDRTIGYDTSYGFGRVGSEIFGGLPTGGMSQYGRIGKALTAYDTLSNALGLGEGLGDVIEQGGFTWGNSLQIAGNSLGLAGNFGGVWRTYDIDDRVRSANPIPQGHSRVYRAVSEAEYQDILQTGRLRQGPNSLEGKWFADSVEGAGLHGDALQGPGKYRIIEVDVPDNAPSLFRQPNLDGRGPARYLHLDDLNDVTPRPLGN
jgi:hypothetical protein